MLTVDMVHHEDNEVDDNEEASVEDNYHDARSESSDSTYYDESNDHDLDSLFDEDDVLVSPPSPVTTSSIIELTKSTSKKQMSRKLLPATFRLSPGGWFKDGVQYFMGLWY